MSLLARILANEPREALRAEVYQQVGALGQQAVTQAEAAAQAGEWETDTSGRVFLAGRCAGHFSTPTLAALQAAAAGTSGHPLRLSLVVGSAPDDPLINVAALQAGDDGSTVFQVASQFNGLEAMDAELAPVATYFSDPTQGPCAALSAYPGALLRHYRAPAPEGGHFCQTEARQLNFLAPVLGDYGQVQHGYLRARDLRDPHGFAAALATDWHQVQVGLQREVEVCLGYGHRQLLTPGPRITQVLTSSLAGGNHYSRGYPTASAEPWLTIQRYLLRAAYTGTLLAAAASGKPRLLLTLIGCGVFGNPPALAWEGLLSALQTVAPHLTGPLEVVVNLFAPTDPQHTPQHLIAAVPEPLQAYVKRSGGRVGIVS